MVKSILDAIMGLSFDDSLSNMAAAALFYILISDVSGWALELALLKSDGVLDIMSWNRVYGGIFFFFGVHFHGLGVFARCFVFTTRIVAFMHISSASGAAEN